ncbi:hypothetical protein RR49_01148 [Microbacterium ginsengisoli]|uniref:Uncharacterized protein n=1 Tax=Microbacterium ginsengisoli TaxID=400772 RepID=A0A0F0M063_9MICO|nr:hypothetical protein [Microbacterium ginsengisoli]KJL37036.1 hypothetical protein RR49_01148 [Microbacterium ginsengisoli]MBN9208129.1 hypothetical protein [Microbacterium ginsengisoli]
MSLNSIPAVTVDAGALGSVIENPSTRRKVYSVWVIIGLALTGVVAALTAGSGSFVLAQQAGLPWPAAVGIAVLAGAAGAYGALSPQMAMLARANTPAASVPAVVAPPVTDTAPADVVVSSDALPSAGD